MSIKLFKYFCVPIYIALFIFATYLTSIISATSFDDMLIMTLTVLFYWFISLVMIKLIKNLGNIKVLLINTTISMVVIAIVTSIQQLLFINIPFSSSFLFLGISLILLLLLHLVANRIVIQN
ncbi:hypothetical protein [Radiobacillus sp. PE A8.2]|uniref:hypothetical protein n=1 Tax=Radiobacillus sp. PE A8.2 TaxID=3380349 RepID=UPI00389021F4